VAHARLDAQSRQNPSKAACSRVCCCWRVSDDQQQGLWDSGEVGKCTCKLLAPVILTLAERRSDVQPPRVAQHCHEQVQPHKVIDTTFSPKSTGFSCPGAVSNLSDSRFQRPASASPELGCHLLCLRRHRSLRVRGGQ
jgi:hypothetical protein